MTSTLLLAACGGEQEEPVPDNYGEADSEENMIIETDEDGNVVIEDESEIAEEEPENETVTDTDTAEDNEPEEDTASDNTDADETQDDSVAELDDDIRATLDQNFEEINWDDVHLTRSEFDASLTELQRSFNEDYDEEEDMDVRIDDGDFSGDTIEIILTNDDESEYADITNSFLAAFLDSFYRQLYLRSDYSDGNTHPHIIIQTSDGEVITD